MMLKYYYLFGSSLGALPRLTFVYCLLLVLDGLRKEQMELVLLLMLTECIRSRAVKRQDSFI